MVKIFVSKLPKSSIFTNSNMMRLDVLVCTFVAMVGDSLISSHPYEFAATSSAHSFPSPSPYKELVTFLKGPIITLNGLCPHSLYHRH